MPSTQSLRATLRALSDWEPYLLAHSNLPGPRGNLELAAAVAEEGTEEQFHRWARLTPDVAPENTPEVFLAFCGVVGLGAGLARDAGVGEAFLHAPTATGNVPSDAALSVAVRSRGNASPLQTLRALAADPRWRIREAVAMALQRWGDADMPALLNAMADWAHGNPWEQRAAAAALCEPRLLKQPDHAAAVLQILDQVTATIGQVTDRRSGPFRTLRQGLAYCWSVAVAALPEIGKPLMGKWLASPDPDIRWILRENLKKNRLVKMDAGWVARQIAG